MSERQIQENWKYPNLPPKPFIYPTAPSHLDTDDDRSTLNKSQLRGFFNLLVIFGIIFFVTQPVINFIDKGYFIEATLYNTFKVDFLFCLVNWPLFFLWSFTSYFLQVSLVKGLSPKIGLVFQHLTQTGLFIYATYVILVNDWCSTHAAFIILQTCTHFMKMHSYITVNRDLRQDYEQSKLLGTQPNSNYPNNVTLSNFALFMFTPWLVYAQYPRRKTINYFYLLKKAFYVAALLLVTYLVHSQFIQPVIQKSGDLTPVELVLRLMLPCTIFLVLLFQIVFEQLCNFFAELSRLDHREFYEDWWNSHTYQQFNRKWNKPVHLFLYRHVYLELMVKYKKTKPVAQLITFLFSAFLHEFLLAVIFRIIRPILLGFMLFQIPLIKLTRWMKAHREGVYLTWFGLIIGPSLILCGYLHSDEEVALMFSSGITPMNTM